MGVFLGFFLSCLESRDYFSVSILCCYGEEMLDKLNIHTLSCSAVNKLLQL